MEREAAPRQPGRLAAVFHGLEGGALVAAFLVSMVLPLVDAVGRPFHGFSIPGSSTYRPQLTLWLAFVGTGNGLSASGALNRGGGVIHYLSTESQTGE